MENQGIVLEVREMFFNILKVTNSCEYFDNEMCLLGSPRKPLFQSTVSSSYGVNSPKLKNFHFESYESI